MTYKFYSMNQAEGDNSRNIIINMEEIQAENFYDAYRQWNCGKCCDCLFDEAIEAGCEISTEDYGAGVEAKVDIPEDIKLGWLKYQLEAKSEFLMNIDQYFTGEDEMVAVLIKVTKDDEMIWGTADSLTKDELKNM